VLVVRRAGLALVVRAGGGRMRVSSSQPVVAVVAVAVAGYLLPPYYTPYSLTHSLTLSLQL
jgi:hypothetical protein